MPKFEVEYSFVGFGSVTIKAKTREEAVEKFYEGRDWGDDDSHTKEYEIVDIYKTS